MATTRITALTELAETPADDDVFALEDVSAGATKKVTTAHVRFGLASATDLAMLGGAFVAHAARHASGGADALTPAAIGALGLDVSAEIVISAAATLTAANLGHMHRCAGTAADYTVILPPVSGNAGSLVGIRIDNAFTKFVTLKGSGNDLIDGVNLRGLWAGELAILLCDGTTWVKIWGISRPMQAKITATAIQSIPNATYTTLRMDAITFDIGGLADLANSRIVARRAGYYEVMANASTSFDSFANLYIVGAFAMASPRSPGAGGSMPSLSGVGTIQAGSTLSIQLFHNYGSSGSTYSQPYPYLYVKELLAW